MLLANGKKDFVQLNNRRFGKICRKVYPIIELKFELLFEFVYKQENFKLNILKEENIR